MQQSSKADRTRGGTKIHGRTAGIVNSKIGRIGAALKSYITSA